MTQILYLIGCQGSGKTTLATAIARGTDGPVVIVIDDESGGQPDMDALRQQHANARLVIVEGTEVFAPALAQLRIPDKVIHLENVVRR